MRTIASTAYTELSTRVAAEMDTFLRGLPTEDGNLLVERMHDACFPAGKLVRPLLFAASAGVCGRDPGDLLSVAIGLEIGHAASLVHDDIIDRDELRRGRTSVWHQHGLESAILTGDALLFALYRTVTQVPADPAVTVEAVRVISEVGHELCLGQVAEADATRGADLSWPTYQRVIALKSASHIRGCLELGAVFAAAPAERRARLRAFGEHLGMAFQMQDDVLAYVGTVDTAGKDPLSDLRACRASLPVVIAAERGSTPSGRCWPAGSPPARSPPPSRTSCSPCSAPSRCSSRPGCWPASSWTWPGRRWPASRTRSTSPCWRTSPPRWRTGRADRVGADRAGLPGSASAQARSAPAPAAAAASAAGRAGCREVASTEPSRISAKPVAVARVNASSSTSTPSSTATAGLTYVITVARTAPTSAISAKKSRKATAVHSTASTTSARVASRTARPAAPAPPRPGCTRPRTAPATPPPRRARAGRTASGPG